MHNYKIHYSKVEMTSSTNSSPCAGRNQLCPVQVSTGQSYRINIENQTTCQNTQPSSFTTIYKWPVTKGSAHCGLPCLRQVADRGRSPRSRWVKTQKPEAKKQTQTAPEDWNLYSVKPVKSQTFTINDGGLDISLSDAPEKSNRDKQVGHRWTGHVSTAAYTSSRCLHAVTSQQE